MSDVAASMKKDWWLFLIRGIVALIFGIFAVFNPSITALTLALYFGLFLIVAGVVDLIVGIGSIGKHEMGWLAIVLGVVEMGIGVYLIQRPGISIATFVLYIVIALLVRGIMDIVAAFDKGLDSNSKALYGVGGALAVVASIVIWRHPAQGALAFVWVLGLYAIVAGALWIAFSFKLRDM